MSKRHASKVEKEQRLLSIQQWIVEGIPYTTIVRQIVHLQWVDKRQAERLISDAWNSLKPKQNQKVEDRRIKRIMQLEHRKNKLKPEFRGTPAGMLAELQYDKEINKLEGNYPETGTGEAPPAGSNNTTVNINALTPELIQKIGKALEEDF